MKELNTPSRPAIMCYQYVYKTEMIVDLILAISIWNLYLWELMKLGE